jgi:hypothetical protein
MNHPAAVSIRFLFSQVKMVFKFGFLGLGFKGQHILQGGPLGQQNQVAFR